MQNAPIHKIELFSPEMFRILLSHEVNRSRRYGDSLTLINLLVETDPTQLEAQLGAETFTINILNLRLRDTDISSKRDNELHILMPATGAIGARTACERIQKLIPAEHQTDHGVTFRLSTFIGMATLPIDHSISSDELTQNAAQALRHARANRLTHVVAFSEIPR